LQTRNWLPVLLVLAALASGACQADKKATVNVGNFKATGTATKVSGPQLVVSNWQSNIFTYGGNLDATGGTFEIKTPSGWYTLEPTTKLQLVNDGGTDFLTLIDSSGNPVQVASVVTKTDQTFKDGEISAKALKTNAKTGATDYLVTIKFLHAIHEVTVRATP